MNFFNTSIAALLLTGLVACKNNSTPNPAANTSTTPSTTSTTATTEPTTNTAVSESEKAANDAAQQLCSCQGMKDYFAKMKTFDGKPEAELAKATMEFMPLKKAFDACKTGVQADVKTKYPNLTKENMEADMNKAMVKTCGDIMPQRLIDKMNAAK